MNRLIPHPVIFLILIALFTLGCQTNPTSPDPQRVSDQPGLSASSTAGSHHCLGFYSLAVDTESHQVEMIAQRSADWHFNLTGILNNTMGVSAAVVPGESDPPNGLFVLDITLAHPFGTSPQFSGFDVKGILIAPGSLLVGSLIFSDTDETRLENADGYTRWWNPTEFTQHGIFGYTQGVLAIGPQTSLTATVNPYKLFADRLGPLDELAWVSDEPLDSDMGRAVFRAGSSNTRRYRIRFPMDPGPQIVFGYAIDCSWNPPTPNPPGEVPDDFPIEANMPEAYRIGLIPTANSLYYDSESGVGGGVLRFQVNVHDWQGQDAGDIPAQVDAVRIFAPSLMPGGVDGVYLNETPTKARYTADLTGLAAPTEAGEVLVVCRAGSTDGSTYQQTGAPAPDIALSAFHAIVLDIPDPVCAGDANNDWGEAVEIQLDEGVASQVCLPDDYRDYYWFEVPAGYALSGDITLYCDAEPTTLGIYDWDQVLVSEAHVSDGMATIPIENVTLYPQRYYLRVFTSNDTQVAPYYLEMAVELTNVTPTSPIEITPPNLYCAPDYAWVQENYLIMYGTLDGVWVYDITDPANPVHVSHELMNMNLYPAFYYPHLYFIDSQGGGVHHIGYIDLSEPAAPVIHHSVIEYTHEIKDLVMNSEHLFILTDEDPRVAMAYDYTSDPLSPSFVHSESLDMEHFWLFDPEGPNTHLIGNLVLGDGYIVSYDVETITAWVYDGSADLGHTVRQVVSQGPYLYILYRDHADTDINIRIMHHHPDDPTLVFDGEFNWAHTFYFITLDGDYAYATGYSDLGVIDISDHGAVEGISVTPVIGVPMRSVAAGNELYVVINGTGLEVYDVSYPPAPDKLTELPVVNAAYCMTRVDDYIVVGDSDDTYQVLKTLDISDPPNTHLVGSLPLTSGFWYISYDDGVIAAMQGTDAVVLMDATDPTDLSIEDTIAFWDTVRGILVNGDALYVSEANGELTVYDVSDPSAPVFMTTIVLGFEVGYPIAGNGLMFGISELDDVRILSLTNPWNPTHVGTYTPSDVPHQISAVGDYMYIICDSVLEIADVSTPASPVYAGSVLTPGTFDYDCQANDGQFVYINAWPYSGALPAICSIWPPDAPEVIFTFEPWPYNNGFAGIIEHDGYLYISSYNGMRIFDLY